MAAKQTDPTEKPGWFERPENHRRLFRGLVVACGIFVAIDVLFFVTGFDKHPYFQWEKWPGFYGVFGFVACVLLVFFAKYGLRPLVRRREDYYESKPGGEEIHDD